ncbi:MAG: hypothetical protein LBO66_09975 [Deltaproteobacteria bacterium]|jgi:type IV pilus assembly protein PilY1|nr:hypothetical protein [Deltaproteobacteria bacterium]
MRNCFKPFRRIRAAFWASLFFLSFSLAPPAAPWALAQTGAAPPIGPDRSKYLSAPFLATSQVIPFVLIVLAKNIQMFQHGYPGLVDLDGDGRVDTGFNPSIVYLGYFDSHSCYSYVGSDFKGLFGAYAYGDPNGYFQRTRATIEDQTQNAIDAARPATLKKYVVSPRSAAGICQNPGTPAANRAFSGNWLNYLSTSRIDAIRKLLYGGARSVDTLADTYLIGSYVPPDSTAWGAEVRSDDTWQEITPLNAYFDISKYTPFDKPTAKKAHFFARSSDLSRADRFPAIRILLNADKSSFTTTGTDGVGQKVSVTEPYGRFWDWVLVNRPLPDDKVLRTDAIRKTIKIYQVRVRACVKTNMAEGEGCLRYPGATDGPLDDVYKPGGLIQKYGEGSNPMYFGLMTGGFNSTIRYQGGKLRNHVGPVLGVPPFPQGAYAPSVNSRTGQFLENGLIANINNLRIAGRVLTADPTLWDGAEYKNTFSWGNPLGEMVYEAARYMGGATEPTVAFANQPDADVAGSTIPLLTGFDSGALSWSQRRPNVSTLSSCAKPIILLISDLTIDHDGDAIGRDLNKPPLQVAYAGGLTPADLPQAFDLAAYLGAITKLEGFDRSGSTKYYFSTGPTGDCSPKTLSGGLSQVLGLCPNGLSSQGTYSAAAAAYYAHVHDFNAAADDAFKIPSGVDLYSVAMSPAFPELVFPIKDSSGKPLKTITLLPVNISTSTPAGITLGFLNYFLLDWDVDKNGLTFHAQIKVNFSDYEQGGDWEGDGQVTYTIDLLTTAATPVSMRETKSVTVDSGDPAIKTLGPFYRFKNPDGAGGASDFISINPDQVKALLVHAQWAESGTGIGIAMGYTITGSKRDGTYLELTMNTPPDSPNLTPKNCPYVGGSDSGAYGCGKKVANVKEQSRIFEFNASSSAVKSLPNPMWLAAKYGGFNDLNHNNIPDRGEWEDSDGISPANYFEATNLVELPDKLETVFKAISRTISTGTATSATLDTIIGGGVSVQTIFYPEYVNPRDPNQKIHWVGSLVGLFVDKWGNLREDSDGDGILMAQNGYRGEKGDYILTFNSVATPSSTPPACYEFGEFISRCFDPRGANQPELFKDSRRHPDNIHQIAPLFDAGQWLSRLDDKALLSASRPYSSAATRGLGQRRIYYGKPNPAGGGAKLALFNTAPEALASLNGLLLHDDFQSQFPGIGDRAQTTRALVEWIIGVDSPLLRSRKVGDPWSDNATPVTWRLGDVINSKPILVGPPNSAFDFLYGDLSYSAFRNLNGGRRQMAYFGGNDGMLHAVNVGFYGSLANGQVSFSRQKNSSQANHELGAEVWAYIPTSLLPQLRWLPDPQYAHAYYVDLKPLINDVKIDGQWRTVLLGGLRLGGRPIETPGPEAGAEHFFAEVFALDITDPESEPKLLWTYSALSQGLTVGLPSFISVEGAWYAVIPSGPVTDTPVPGSLGRAPSVKFGTDSPFSAYSNQRARLIVLNAATGREVPEAAADPNFLAVKEENSFFNNPFLPAAQIRETPWTNHALYFGLTVSRNPRTGLDGGAVYRLQTVDSGGEPLPVSLWRLKRFFNTDRPVTGAVNATYDPIGNLWIAFGTGRLWSLEDIAPCLTTYTPECLENHAQYIYGIKEELFNGRMTFRDRSLDEAYLIDVTGATVFRNGEVHSLPTQPLFPTGPGGATTYQNLLRATLSNNTLGYKRRLNIGTLFKPGESHAFEMVVTQPKIVGVGAGKSLMAFTTFEPKFSGCGGMGDGYLYLVDTYTGLPEPSTYHAFYSESLPPGSAIQSDQVVGALSTGEGNPTEAFLTVTASGIMASASAPDASTYTARIPQDVATGGGVTAWREVLDTGYHIPPEARVKDLD